MSHYTVYNPDRKSLVKTVLYDGSHMLEIPPEGLSFGSISITYNQHKIIVYRNETEIYNHEFHNCV